MSQYLVDKTYQLREVNEIISREPEHPNESASIEDGDDFSGCSYEEAVELATLGDFETLEKVDKEAAQLAPKVGLGLEGYGRKRIKECAGDSLDVGVYLSGEPRCMVDFVRTSQPNRLVRIVNNMSATWSVDKKTIGARGAAIFTLIRAIELRGYSTELTLVMPSPNCLLTIVLKKFGEHLNPAVATFYMCHASCLRRIGFRLMEDNPMDIRRQIGAVSYGGYGRVTDLPEDRRPDRAVYFEALFSDSKEMKKSEYWYNYGAKQLEKFGIKMGNMDQLIKAA